MPPTPSPTGVAITNPLVLYRSLLATKRIDPDPAQHRLALHLQTLYERLKDYEPVIQYNHRLQQISRALAQSPGQYGAGAQQNEVTKPRRGVLSSLFEKAEERESMALTKVLTSHESAIHLDSPKGLMLHGEVGTGKSMLIDLFADCLPNRKKKRRHFSTFMLEIYAKLEQLRRSRQIVIPASLGEQDEYSLLYLAREMISDGAILFIDEFQLPDRAASKIMTNLMTSFFHLGGVLIATSNRMPEELSKAAGIEFAPPPSRMDSLSWFRGARGRVAGKSEAMYGGKSEFAAFLEVLRARCDVWEMENGKDYRRLMSEDNAKSASADNACTSTSFEGLEPMAAGNIGLGFEQSTAIKEDGSELAGSLGKLPKNYFTIPSPDEASGKVDEYDNTLQQAIISLFPNDQITTSEQIPWKQTTVPVYGRHVLVPRHHDGTTKWTFNDLCGATLGPADYISIASTFHTLILTDVPVLSLLQKNEARRLINLLDALYEARCRLLITAEAGPDDLFFPESNSSNLKDHNSTATADEFGEQEVVDQDATYAETLSEVYQDATAPFRPNISLYEDGGSTSSAPSEPDYTHARLAPDQLEDGPPNMLRRGDSIYGRDTAPLDSGLSQSVREGQIQSSRGPDFSKGGIFTGEDEKFAFKRARSRMWEMCGAKWWAREGGPENWWQPLDASIRGWEKPVSERVALHKESVGIINGRVVSESRSQSTMTPSGEVAVSVESDASDKAVSGFSEATTLEEQALHGPHSPFRVAQEPPPKFSWTHIWGTMKWGRKAGAWGQGVEGLEQRNKAREEEKEAEGRKGVTREVDINDRPQTREEERQARIDMMKTGGSQDSKQ